jgi:hypothetical protein
MKPYIGNVRFVPPIDICPTKYPQTKGFQSLQSQLGKDLWGEPYRGFCLMWSLFFIELVLMNPDKTTDEIITEALDIVKEDPEYLLQVIKGYVRLAEIVAKSIADSAGIKDWSLKLEKEDRNSPLYQGLFSSKSKEVKQRLGDYFTELFLNINSGTRGARISKSIKPEEAKVASKYEQIIEEFKENSETDKLRRAFKSIRPNKTQLATLFDAIASTSYKNMLEQFWKSNNYDAEKILNYKYKLFAEYLTDKYIERYPNSVGNFVNVIETLYQGNKRAGTILKKAKESKEKHAKSKGSGILDDLKSTFNKGVKAVKSGL